MTFPKYDSYKDSGVEWLGEIPLHWSIYPIRAIFQERNEKNLGIKTDFVLSVMKDKGVIPYDEKGNVGNKKSEDIEHYKVVYPGDLVVNKMNAIIGSLGLSEYYGVLSQVYFVLYPKDKTIGDKDFLGYLFKVKPFQKSLIKICKGIMELRESIEFDEFKKLLLPLPPLAEQQKIVAFLNYKTVEIDEAIAKKQRLIKLLQEQKAILINQAVTKGLNPKAPMRDSGVEWIGEIPATWRISRIKYLVENFNGIQMGPFGSMLIDISEQPTPYKLYGQQNTISGDFSNVSRWLSPQKFKSLKKYVVKAGDIVTTRKGSIGNCRLIGSDVDEGVIDSDTIRIRVNNSIIVPDFLALLLHEAYYVNSMIFFNRRGAVLSGLNTSTIADLIIAFPNIDEQMEILNYVRKLQEQFNYTFEVINNHLTTLNEYKSQIIAQTVTGKIKV